MLENGTDIRYIQAMLGHAELSTTEIYTQVSIKKLKAVHTATHPARPIGSMIVSVPSEEAEGLLDMLEAEAAEEEST